MSRGLGRLQRSILRRLRRAECGLTLVELRCLVLGSRATRRGHLLRGREGRCLPLQRDDRALRRALDGLERRGLAERTRDRPIGWRRVQVCWISRRRRAR